jgi:hypothetical protein
LFRQAELFFADAVIAVVLQHLLNQISGISTNVCLSLDADLADRMARNVSVNAMVPTTSF